MENNEKPDIAQFEEKNILEYSEVDRIGMAVAGYFGWDVNLITKAFMSALGNAYLHTPIITARLREKNAAQKKEGSK